MNNKIIYLFIGLLCINIYSCKKKGCTDPNATNYDENAQKDDGSCEYDEPYNVTLSFNHYYNELPLAQSDLDIIKYTNQAGNQHSISKLQYLISDLRFYKSNNDSIVIDSYNLIDMNNTNSVSFELSNVNLQNGSYNGIGLIFGFQDDDNISGEYQDLNSAGWSWPEMLGGGYHFMKLEGKFINTSSDTTNFTYHMGTAREITMTDTIFHANHFFVKIDTTFDLTNNATINLKVNLEEWFENPNTWDLNQYYSMLMTNYDAQIMMRENGAATFSWGSITQ